MTAIVPMAAGAGHGQVVACDRGDLLDGRRRAVLGVDDDLNGDLQLLPPVADGLGVEVQGAQGAVERGAVELVEAGQVQQPAQLIAALADCLADGSVAAGVHQAEMISRRKTMPPGLRLTVSVLTLTITARSRCLPCAGDGAVQFAAVFSQLPCPLPLVILIQQRRDLL
jgi:hypothetical protein